MGKNDLLTPKAIANRMKAKGLLKLRWYCQMCQKQCRDENGFKCHTMSEGHQRQMQVFGENPDLFVEFYSQEFQTSFLDHLKRSHRFSRVAATVVYNEYIADRQHVHMTATQWPTLTDFVKYLGRTGKCKVEETPKGWFMTYINQELLKEKLKKKKRPEREIEEQIQRAESNATKRELPLSDFIKENVCNGKVAFSWNSKKPRTGNVENPNPSKFGNGEGLEERKDYWLCEGIVVKVMRAEKGYYRQKGIVLKVIGKYVAEIKMIESGRVVRVDEAELETVIPQIGGVVRVVNGAYRGCNARLLEIDTSSYCATVQIEKSLYDGRLLPAVEYEDICKVA